jgi:hypothetical protein
VTALERWTPTGIDEIDRAVATWRPASMVPAQFKTKAGAVNVEDLALAAHWLHVLDVPPLPNIPDVYVIKGRVGLMAALQRALAARAGYDLEVTEETDQRATVRIRPAGGAWKPSVTVTIEQARQAGWADRSANNPYEPSNYEKIPARMLAARACTHALDLYAAGVRRGIAAAAVSVAEPADNDEFGDLPPGPAAVGEVRPSGPGDQPRQVPARSVAPDGSTIAEHLREPAVSEEVRAQLVARVEALDGPTADELRDICRALGLPNLRTGRFTRAHGALLARLIDEAIANAETVEADGPVPEGVYDDTPEAGGYDPDDDALDPGRPFA